MTPIAIPRQVIAISIIKCSVATDVGSQDNLIASLCSGEEILHDTRPTIMSWPLPLAFGWLVLPVVYSWWRKRRTRYVITNRRVLIERNRPARETVEITYDDIVGVRVKKEWAERFSQYGTIQLDTESQGTVKLRAVPEYTEIAKTIQSYLPSE